MRSSPHYDFVVLKIKIEFCLLHLVLNLNPNSMSDLLDVSSEKKISKQHEREILELSHLMNLNPSMCGLTTFKFCYISPGFSSISDKCTTFQEADHVIQILKMPV